MSSYFMANISLLQNVLLRHFLLLLYSHLATAKFLTNQSTHFYIHNKYDKNQLVFSEGCVVGGYVCGCNCSGQLLKWSLLKGLHYSKRLILTCLSICAAMWWLQSKMIRNSRLLFISLRRGLVSWVSRGSWRIFSLMLYLDGAIISSCSLIRPEEDKQHKWRQDQNYHNKNAVTMR